MLFVGCRRLPGMPKAPQFKFDGAAASVPAAAPKAGEDTVPADEPVVAKETEGHGVELVAPSAHAEDEDDAVSRRRSSVRPHSSGESMGFEGGEFADAPTALDKHHKFPLLHRPKKEKFSLRPEHSRASLRLRSKDLFHH